jgi:DDE family transposase
MDDQARPPTLSEMLLERFARKNPLAASLRLVLEQLFAADAINAVFERHRCLQYTSKILFVTVVEVMLAVVTGKVDSAHAAMRRHGKALGATITAFYDKLNGTEPQVATALVAHAFTRGKALLAQMGGLRKDPLPGWRLRILDGNHLAATQRRLEVLWQVSAGPLPGLALVAFDVAAMMMSDVILCEDGHASERALTAEILALVVKADCWIADRNFCTHEILFGILMRGGAFVIRQHASVVGEFVGPRVARGRCATGAVFEQPLKLTDDGVPRTVRRVTVVLDTPTRDGERELHILTSLPPEVTAATVALLYLSRWTIESAFADLARWLDAELAPLGYPRAALLGFCVGLMAYNAIATLLGALRATHGEKVVRDQVSGYYLAQFGREAVGHVDDFIEPEGWEVWRRLPLAAAAALLKEIAARIDLAMIRKSKRGPKKPVPKRTRFKNKPHVSTKRLLDGTAEEDR